MIYLYIITLAALVISFFADRAKTYKALKIAWKKLSNISPAFIVMLIIISISLYFLPESSISKLLNNGNKYISVLIASLIGSITLLPGFIAFPLCGLLLKQGVLYMVISAFSTTLMMVGIISFPVEKEYFGTRTALLRNLICFIIALIVAFATGLFFGEIY